jgi:hypothetical protein
MISCGGGWSRCCRIRPAVSSIQAVSATRPASVWKGCCICSTRGCVTSICPASSASRPARPAGGGCLSGSSRVFGSKRWRRWSPNWTGQTRSTGHASLLTPRSSTRKRGLPGRAEPGQPRLSLNQIPFSSRRERLAAPGPARPRQRKRTRPPAPPGRRDQGGRLPAALGLGRPRLLQQPAAPSTPRTVDHPADQPTPPRRRPTPRRPTGQTAERTRPQTPHPHTRPERPPPLGRRTHQRLAPPLQTTQHPHRTQQPDLPRLPHPRTHHHPRPRIVSSLPGTGRGPSGHGGCLAPGFEPREPVPKV